MTEYIENGVRLGWLIDTIERKVHIYRANGETEILENPEKISGEDVLPGFELEVREIF
jgi:Uma2 family endonuclease